jgi:uncharacterized HAD superfamily protein
MVSKTIYVDLDDVLCQAARHFLRVIEREFGKRIAYEQLINFDVGHSSGLSASEREELYRIVHRPEELLVMEPVRHAAAALEGWQSQGFEIAIVTGRPPESREISLEWLAKHEIPHSSFMVVDKYARFTTENTGALSLDELAQRKFCWAVEDSLPIAQFLAERMKLSVALIDCPWNRCDRDPERVSRHRDWQSIAAAMDKLEMFDERSR